MKKRIMQCVLVVMCLIAGISNGAMALAAMPDQIEPMYVGLEKMNPKISISSGTLSCEDLVTIKNGYSAEIVWELLSGTGTPTNPIATWKRSGTGVLPLLATRAATPGYNYRLKTSVKVYNSTGTLVDNVTKYSTAISY